MVLDGKHKIGYVQCPVRTWLVVGGFENDGGDEEGHGEEEKMRKKREKLERKGEEYSPLSLSLSLQECEFGKWV